MITWTSSKIKPSKEGTYLIKIYDKRSGKTSYTDAYYKYEEFDPIWHNENESRRNIGWTYCECCRDGDVIGWSDF